MEVVLQQDYPALGYVGDKIRVRPGYARNYLIPRGIAVELASRNAKQLRHRLTQIEAKRAKLKKAAEEYGKNFEGMILEFHLKIGEKGKSFGAVSVRDIENALKERNVQVDRKQIRLHDAIKAGGDYPVEIKLHSEVIVPITARVIVERLKSSTEKDEKPARKGRGRKKEASDEMAQGDEVEAVSADQTSEALPAEE
ncbi:MAG: 50S ribosomal protein L9 [Deltaproteobacteria bacterium]|nr:50S ribosomal protein L9 [Deltaproteobacteria bacterium]